MPRDSQGVVLCLFLGYYSLLVISSAVIASESQKSLTLVLLDLSLELAYYISSSPLDLSTWIFCHSPKLSTFIAETIVSPHFPHELFLLIFLLPLIEAFVLLGTQAPAVVSPLTYLGPFKF